MPLRVEILSDDQWVRAGLGAMCEEAGLMVGPDPDVLLWDVHTAEMLLDSQIPILALVVDEPRATRAIRAGAKGVLLRDSNPHTLSAAVQALAQGLTVLEPQFLEALLPASEPEGMVEELSSREHQVLQLLALGLSNKAIARRLEITEHTAKFHVAQILSKLGVESRTEAVVRSVQLGLVLL